MKIVKRLNVPASFFYSQVMKSVLFDIDDSTGKQMKLNQLENFEYVKEFVNKGHAKIMIEKVEENRFYRFKTSTTKNEFTSNYEIVPISDTICEVRYSEEMVSHGWFQKANDLALGTFLGYFKKRQLKVMLEAIEALY